MSLDAFNKAFAETIGLEGKYSDDEKDPGNWTGGKVGVGQLKGTMYGISAASYPDLDIMSLDPEKAKAIYLKDFWQVLKCDQFESDAVAIALFKQAVNDGQEGAVKILQRSLKISPADGVVGNITLGNVNSLPPKDVLEAFLGECAWQYTQDDGFATDGRGWLNRVVKTAVEAQCP